MPYFRQKIFEFTKGFRNRSKNCYRIATGAVRRALRHSHRDRKDKQSNWRRLHITQVNAGCGEYGMSYSRMMGGLKKEQIDLNRKMLAELAQYEPLSFASIMHHVKHAQNIPPKKHPNLGLLQTEFVTNINQPDWHPRQQPKPYVDIKHERLVYNQLQQSKQPQQTQQPQQQVKQVQAPK